MATPRKTHTHPILALATKQSLIRSRDVQAIGQSRGQLSALAASGSLVRLSRGLYTLPTRPGGEHSALAQVAIQAPQAVVCLLSALQFHGLSTQNPFAVWLAIGNKSHAPRITYPPLRIVRFSDAALADCAQPYTIDGVAVRITTVEKTIVDCFKFRNKIGLDVALEALRDAWDQKKIHMDTLWPMAVRARVANVMRPYLESLI